MERAPLRHEQNTTPNCREYVLCTTIEQPYLLAGTIAQVAVEIYFMWVLKWLLCERVHRKTLPVRT